MVVERDRAWTSVVEVVQAWKSMDNKYMAGPIEAWMSAVDYNSSGKPSRDKIR
jgi:hypothetical protein